MKEIKVVCLIALLLLVVSCSKDETSTGLADKVTGTYNGITTYGTTHLDCITKITKASDTKVRMSVVYEGANFLFGEIAVINAGNDKYLLSFSDQSGSIDGVVEGNTLTYSISNGVLNTLFTGTR
jgi:hypothetical protein